MTSSLSAPAGRTHSMEIEWLDKIIEEQAAYYGMTKEKHAALMRDAAQFDEDNPHL